MKNKCEQMGADDSHHLVPFLQDGHIVKGDKCYCGEFNAPRDVKPQTPTLIMFPRQ